MARNHMGKKGKIHPRQIYWPNCMVCQYMKRHKDFKLRVMKSSYVDPAGTENMLDVLRSYGNPFKPTTMYMHMKRHQAADLESAKLYAITRQETAPVPVVAAVEGQVMSNGEHELGLDEFIRTGRGKLMAGEMPMTANAYLQAIKIKSDIEKNTKDRRMEMIKSFFSGGNKDGQTEDGGSSEQAPAS